MAATIGWLTTKQANFDTKLLYVSDHGESLGENNLFLHGLPFAVAPIEQKHVPMVFWGADASTPAARAEQACIAAQRDAALTHDNLFHTALGLLGVRATEYKPPLDAFASCRAR